MTLVRSILEEIYAPIEGELREFEAVLKRELHSQDPLIKSINDHLLKMTGKWLRPALALFSSHLDGTAKSSKAIELAAAIELIHTATLVHDDIIDGSEFRRNQPSVYSKWGREISIVSGDYLYSKAFMLLADLKDIWVNQAFSACARTICEGEMKQIEKRKDFLMPEEEYFKIIYQKTAALFQAACMGGAYFSGASQAVIAAAGSYGHSVGIAFQITDDCLDLIGQSEHLGKTAGLDVYKNDVTLPLLYLFAELNENERKALWERLKNPGAAAFDEIRRACIERKIIERAMDKGREYAERAIGDLVPIKDSIYKEGLTALAQHCVERVR